MLSIRISTSFAQPPTSLPILRRVPTSGRRLSELGEYTATKKIPDFKLICKRFWPKGVCLRGSSPDPAGDLQRPQTISWKRLGYPPIRPPPTFVSGSMPIGISNISCRWLVQSFSGPWSFGLNTTRWRTGLVECALTKPARHRSQCKRGIA